VLRKRAKLRPGVPLLLEVAVFGTGGLSATVAIVAAVVARAILADMLRHAWSRVAGVQAIKGAVPVRTRARAGSRRRRLFGAHRPLEDKRAVTGAINKLLVDALGVSPDDIFIALIPAPNENFSFGRGELQLTERAPRWSPRYLLATLGRWVLDT
jgi:hypothetical protein